MTSGPMLSRAARRYNSCCGHGRHCEDWSHQHANWPATKRAQRQAEKREWRRELLTVPQGRENAIRYSLATR